MITGGLGVVFKGEGFYVNDSRAGARSSAGPKGAEPGGNKPDDGKPAGSETDTRAKPGGAGEKPVAAGDGAVHDGKRTDKAGK